MHPIDTLFPLSFTFLFLLPFSVCNKAHIISSNICDVAQDRCKWQALANNVMNVLYFYDKPTYVHL